MSIPLTNSNNMLMIASSPLKKQIILMKKAHFKSIYYTHLLLGAKIIVVTGLLTFKISVSIAQTVPFPLRPIDEKRVQEIERVLSDKPSGFGEPYNKRAVWNKLLKSGDYDRFLRGMKNYSFPAFSKDDYFSRGSVMGLHPPCHARL